MHVRNQRPPNSVKIGKIFDLPPFVPFKIKVGIKKVINRRDHLAVCAKVVAPSLFINPEVPDMESAWLATTLETS